MTYQRNCSTPQQVVQPEEPEAFRRGGADKVEHVILIDRDRLAALMIRHDVGVSTSHTYEVKHVDSDYFEEE